MSLRFITDEDVPRSTARVLRDAGFDAVDVRDVGLRGKSDAEVFEYAQEENRLLIRVPDSESIGIFNHEVLRAVQEVGENLSHHLAIVEVGKVRLRG